MAAVKGLALLVAEKGVFNVFNVPKPVVLKLDESIDLLAGFIDDKMLGVAAVAAVVVVLAFCVAANRENCGVDVFAKLDVAANMELLFAVLSGCELLVPNENNELVPFALLVAVALLDDGVKLKSDVDDDILAVGSSDGFEADNAASAGLEGAERPVNEKTGFA